MRRLNRGHVRYSWVVLIMGTFVVFGSLGLARFGYSLVLPSMQSALRLDNRGAGGLATANLIGYLLLSLIGGALASRYGSRLVISVGMTFVGLGMLFTGASNTFFSALIWRLITGIGSGSSNVPVMGLMSAWFGTSFRGLATGIAVSGSSIALIVTGPSVPRLLSAFPVNGWRITWYIFGGFSLLLALLAAFYLRNEPLKNTIKTSGSLESRENVQIKSGTELQWRLVYRSPIVWHLGIIYATFGFSYIIYITFFIRYLVGEIGYTKIAAGNLFMLMGWFSLGCGLIWGGLSDRIGRRSALIIVYLIQILSFVAFALWQRQPGPSISAVLFGLTAWSTPAIMAATCGDVVGHRLAPAALGFITLFFGIGQSLGPFIAGLIADMKGSFVGAFLLAAAVAFLGVIATLFLKPANVRARV